MSRELVQFGTSKTLDTATGIYHRVCPVWHLVVVFCSWPYPLPATKWSLSLYVVGLLLQGQQLGVLNPLFCAFVQEMRVMMTVLQHVCALVWFINSNTLLSNQLLSEYTCYCALCWVLSLTSCMVRCTTLLMLLLLL